MDDWPAPDGPALLEVGRIDKPHGVRGEVVVSLITHRLERLAPGSALQTDRGELIVEASRPHQHRHLVRFDAIADRDAAERWRGVVLSAPPVDETDDGTLWVHRLVGAVVVDQHGAEHGEVVALVENPASDLLELADGRLVPLAFLVDYEPGVRIDVDVPIGLLDGEANTPAGQEESGR
ncbi:MAG: ribosome maturation factor RimM [Actinomycetota bacterium]|nr:ribosome maturation factor RimM [Actinomycetota bacterium]